MNRIYSTMRIRTSELHQPYKQAGINRSYLKNHKVISCKLIYHCQNVDLKKFPLRCNETVYIFTNATLEPHLYYVSTGLM